MKNRPLILVLLLISAIFVFGQDYPSFPIGQYWQFPDARSLSLGGAGSVSLNAPGAMLYNPAALTQIQNPVEGALSLSIRKLDERRSFPLYDRFDGIVAQGIYAINNNWYFRPQGAVAFRLPFAGLNNLTFAAGSFTEIDQNYNYLEEVRQNIFGDSLVAYNRIEFNGALQRYGVAAAAPVDLLPGFSFGVQAGILQGSLDNIKEVDFVRRNQKVVQDSADRKLENTPVVVSVGAVYRATERITGGVYVDLPYTVKYSSINAQDAELREEIGYPLKLNAGFEYRARQMLQARLNVDFGYEFWSSAKYTSQISSDVVPATQELSDVFVAKAGIEYIFFNKVPFRVGMQYRNSYQQRGNTQTVLGAGTGFSNTNWKVDVAGAFSSVTYKWPDLFNDQLFGGDRLNSTIDDVSENTFFGRITLTVFLK